MKIRKLVSLIIGVFTVCVSALAESPQEDNPFAALTIVVNTGIENNSQYKPQPMPEVYQETTLTISDNRFIYQTTRKAEVTIYKDGMQKYKFPEGTFFYVKPKGKMNSYSGEEEIDYNYRMPSETKLDGWPVTYFPEIVGTLAYMKNDGSTSEIYRKRNGEIYQKYVTPQYTLIIKIPNSSTISGIPYCFTASTTSHAPLGPLENSVMIKDGIKYPYYKYEDNTHKWKRNDNPYIHSLNELFNEPKLYPMNQHVESNGIIHDFVVAPGDSIIGIDNKGNYIVVNYADGSYEKYSMMKGKEWTPFEANIKRDNNIVGCYLDYNGRPTSVIKFTDGPYKDHYVFGVNFHETRTIKFDPNITYKIVDAAWNTVAEIIDGKTTEEHRLIRVAEEEIKRLESAKYGSKYVYGALQKDIYIGAPEAMVVAYFDHKVRSKANGVTVYEVVVDQLYPDFDKKVYTSKGYKHKKSSAKPLIVTVTNKKVTRVQIASWE